MQLEKAFRIRGMIIQEYLHTLRETYTLEFNMLNTKMKVWNMMFLFNWVMCRFHVNFPGCTGIPIPSYVLFEEDVPFHLRAGIFEFPVWQWTRPMKSNVEQSGEVTVGPNIHFNSAVHFLWPGSFMGRLLFIVMRCLEFEEMWGCMGLHFCLPNTVPYHQEYKSNKNMDCKKKSNALQ